MLIFYTNFVAHLLDDGGVWQFIVAKGALNLVHWGGRNISRLPEGG